MEQTTSLEKKDPSVHIAEDMSVGESKTEAMAVPVNTKPTGGVFSTGRKKISTPPGIRRATKQPRKQRNIKLEQLSSDFWADPETLCPSSEVASSEAVPKAIGDVTSVVTGAVTNTVTNTVVSEFDIKTREIAKSMVSTAAPSDVSVAPPSVGTSTEIATTSVSTDIASSAVEPDLYAAAGIAGRPLQPPRKFDSQVKETVFKWALCHKSNRRGAPRSDQPAIRVCGFYTNDKAANTAMDMHNAHPYVRSRGIGVYLDRVKMIAMVPLSPDRNAEECVAKRKNAIFSSENKWKNERKKEFDKNIRERHNGEIDGMRKRRQEVMLTQRKLRKENPVPREVIEKRVADARAAMSAANADGAVAHADGVTAPTGSAVVRADEVLMMTDDEYPDELRVRGQEAAIMSVLVDTSLEAETWNDAEGAGYEPIYILHGGYMPDEAKKITENVIWKPYSDGETLIGDMYVWLFLDEESVNNPDVPDNYLNSEQHIIMNRKRQDELDAQAFMELCADNKKNIPVIDLSNPEGKGLIPAIRRSELVGEAKIKADEEELKYKEIEQKILRGTPSERREAHEVLKSTMREGMVDADGNLLKGTTLKSTDDDDKTIDVESDSKKKRFESTEDSIRELMKTAKRE